MSSIRWEDQKAGANVNWLTDNLTHTTGGSSCRKWKRPVCLHQLRAAVSASGSSCSSIVCEWVGTTGQRSGAFISCSGGCTVKYDRDAMPSRVSRSSSRCGRGAAESAASRTCPNPNYPGRCAANANAIVIRRSPKDSHSPTNSRWWEVQARSNPGIATLCDTFNGNSRYSSFHHAVG